MFVFKLGMAITRGRASTSKFGSGLQPTDEWLCDFITSEITCGIMESTPVIFGTIKEGIMDLMDERLKSLRAKIIAGYIRAWTLSFREFKVYGAP